MRIYNGTILTCDNSNHIFRYLVEDKGIIQYVGDDLPTKFQGIPTIELGSQVLLPSFVDTHLHFASMSLFHAGLNVMDVTSNEEMKEKLAEFLPKTKAKVIIAFGASPHSVKERTLLSRSDLDSVTKDRPVMVVKYDGHACIVNTALLEKLPEKIKTIRGYNPHSGEMNQEAFFATTDYVTNTVTVGDLVKSMQKAIDYMATKGIGMLHTVTGIGFPKDMDVDLERYVGRGASSGFQMRVFFQTMDIDKVKKKKASAYRGMFCYSTGWLFWFYGCCYVKAI